MTRRLAAAIRSKNGRLSSTGVQRSSAGCAISTGQAVDRSGSTSGTELRWCADSEPNRPPPPSRSPDTAAFRSARFAIAVIRASHRTGTRSGSSGRRTFIPGRAARPSGANRAAAARTAASRTSSRHVTAGPSAPVRATAL